MKNLVVIGKDVSASSSPKMHSFIADKMNNAINYGTLSIKQDDFESIVEKTLESYDGLNVTIPYKLSIIPHLNQIFGDAISFGAVNTVKAKKCNDGVKYYGYNTDGLGFMLMLENAGVQVDGKKFLLLGSGGAGRSVAKKLLDGGATVVVYDRNVQNAKKVSEEFKGVQYLNSLGEINNDFYAVINATGVGMHDSVGVSPVGEDILKNCQVAIDLIYVPEKSKFLEIAESLGKKIVNGKAMLFYQAYYAECIFFDVEADAQFAKTIFEDYLKEE